MMELYDYFRSSASYRVRIVLNYKCLDYTKHEVHLLNQGGEQNSVEYEQINFQKLVPALKINDCTILTQSLAIIEYLEEEYPEPPILPRDKLQRAEARRLAYIIACDVHPLNNLRVLKYLVDTLDIAEHDKTSWYHNWIHLGFKSYEAYISQYKEAGKYSLGKNFTLADVCLIPQVYNALRFELPMNSYPNIMRVYENCLKLDYVNNAKP